jgi:Calcineurin-like phosphoesterase
MGETRTIFVLSDIHYASAAEKARGGTELTAIGNPLLRLCVRAYRHFIWKRDPFAHNHLLDEFLEQSNQADYVVGNGDYSCDTAFTGVSDDACFQSVHQCVSKLRERFGSKLRLTLGDHELGKLSLFGGRGGIRIASWERAQRELEIAPFWQLGVGKYVLLGVTSSLLAFPIFEPDSLPMEHDRWHELRARHLSLIRERFLSLQRAERMILFCHDPTALPFLWRDEPIRSRLSQLDTTVIGHLHSQLFLWQSRLLSGMPAITFLGNSIRRMSSALHEARLWRHFHVKLCPALAGIELLDDGGYLRLELDPDATRPPQFHFCRFSRRKSPRGGQPDRSCR